MKINRDGKTYELDPDEVYMAYKEQQHIYDKLEIECYSARFNDNEFLTRFGFTPDVLMENIDFISKYARDVYNKYYEFDMETSIVCALQDFNDLRGK